MSTFEQIIYHICFFLTGFSLGAAFNEFRKAKLYGPMWLVLAVIFGLAVWAVQQP